MNRWFATSIAVVCTSVSVAASAAAAAPAPPAADPSKAEGRFKNIQVFKGYPADDVLPAMQFLSAALGVDCEYCHVERAPEKDDKKEKQTARKMIEMTFAINRQHFDGHREVTCMSCHHVPGGLQDLLNDIWGESKTSLPILNHVPLRPPTPSVT